MHKRNFVLLLAIVLCLSSVSAARCEEKKTSKYSSKKDAVQAIADCIVQLDDDKALKTLAEALTELPPADAEYVLKIGSSIEEKELKGQAAEARKNGSDRDLRLKRCIAAFHVMRGRSLIDEKNYAGAVEHFQHATRLDDKNPVVYFVSGLDLIKPDDPVLASSACKYFEKAQQMGWESFTLPVMIGMAQCSSGNDEAGLKSLEKAVVSIPDEGDAKEFKANVTAKIAEVKQHLAKVAAAPIEASKRQYTIPPGSLAVVVAVNKDKKLIKMAISGRHDPDGGKQDGIDDGIIEMPMNQVVQPGQEATIYRPGEPGAK